MLVGNSTIVHGIGEVRKRDGGDSCTLENRIRDTIDVHAFAA